MFISLLQRPIRSPLRAQKTPTVTTFTAIGPTSVSTAVGVHVSVSTNPIAGGTLTISDLATGNVVHRESMYTGSWNGTITGIKPSNNTLVATLDLLNYASSSPSL